MIEPVNGVTLANAEVWAQAFQTIDALQDFVGLVGDAASSSAGAGSIVSRVKRLEIIGGAEIIWSTTPPASPTASTIWVHTGLTPRQMAYYDTVNAIWVGFAAVAANIQGTPVTDAVPADGQLLGYDADTDTIVWVPAAIPDIITAIGQIIVGNASGDPAVLAVGDIGQMLGNDGTGALAWQWPVYRAVALVGLNTPTAPTVTPQGTPGSTSYSYYVIAEDARGYKTLASSAGSTSTGNATLNGTNFNRITWPRILGAVKYHVLKTNTSTKLGEVTEPTRQLDDTGQATSAYTYSARNETLDIDIPGYVRINGGVLDVAGLASEPPVSAAGRARVYYQTTGVDAGLRASLDGDPYAALATGGGGGGGPTFEEPPHPFLFLGA